MKRLMNKAAIKKTTYDSTYIGVLSYHGLQLKEDGVYVGHIVYGNEIVDYVNISVSDEHESMQANIDFQNFDKHGVNQRGKLKYKIKPGGYLLLINSTGNTTFRLKLEKPGDRPGSTIVCDTNELNKGDIYSCVLLRPGSYEICFKNKRAGVINVKYPTAKTSKSNLSEAIRIQVHQKGLKPETISSLPMQGVVFDFQTSGSIQVNLIEEDKFKGQIYDQVKEFKKVARDKPLGKYRWRNPKYSNSK